MQKTIIFCIKLVTKKVLLKFMKHIVGKLGIVFLCLLNFSQSKALALSFKTFFNLPEPDFITCSANNSSYGLSHTAKKQKMRLLIFRKGKQFVPQ